MENRIYGWLFVMVTAVAVVFGGWVAYGFPVAAAQTVADEPLRIVSVTDGWCGTLTLYSDHSGRFTPDAETMAAWRNPHPVRGATAVIVNRPGVEITGTYESPCGVFVAYSDGAVSFSSFATPGSCPRDWQATEVDSDGEQFWPIDDNGDGVISCESDIEMGR